MSRAAVEAAWRLEAPRLIGALLRYTGDLARAEDLAQDALVLALERWSDSEIPRNPGAWLLAVAKNRAIDEARRHAMREDKHRAIAHELARVAEPAEAPVDDDVLRLALVTCHPALSREARVALTLKLVAGLSTAQIARAYLCPEPTIAQRIVRAQRTLREARVPFEAPEGTALLERIPAVLEVIYLIFNEGYSAHAGSSLQRGELCDEALRLGRVLVALLVDHAEAHALLALMELQASRSRARTDANGGAILLADQDRSKWDRLAIARGLAALDRARALARPLGSYALQASIAACHARAARPEDTDWERIVALYDALVAATGSPVVELNRIVAISMVDGPEDALALLDALDDEPALRGYPWLDAVRGDLLARLGQRDRARRAFERAASLTANERERDSLLRRARAAG